MKDLVIILALLIFAVGAVFTTVGTVKYSALIEREVRYKEEQQELLKLHKIWRKHGACAIYSDFTHAIRTNNGERFRLKKEEK